MPKLRGDAELALAGALLAAVGIAEVPARAAQLLLDAGDAFSHLGAGVPRAQLCQGIVAARMGPDGDERILGELAQLVPGHDEVGVGAGRVDVVRGGQLGDDGARLRLRQLAQPPIDLVIGRVLLGRRRQPEVARFAVHAKGDLRTRRAAPSRR